MQLRSAGGNRPHRRWLALVAAAWSWVGGAVHAQALLLTVAKDGSGDVTTVQRAIDRVPSGSSGLAVIEIGPGHFVESVSIPKGKIPLVLAGRGRGQTFLEFDRSSSDSLGEWVATPVLTNRSNAVVIRSLTIRNLAREPGGSGGKWDSAVRNYGDRLILNDVELRADHDTLLMYGPAFGAGPGPSRVYVHHSTIQGRGDFIASFSSVFIESSVLETIRDRGHFLFQMGNADAAPSAQDALVVRSSLFTGRSLDPIWPCGVTNLFDHAVVYLIGNTFAYDAGANRPVAHFHDAFQPDTSIVRHYGNTQSLSTRALDWSVYSFPGKSTPRVEVPASLSNDFGQPIVGAMTSSAAAAVTPQWLFGDWNPRTQEPRSGCADGIDNDRDGRTDFTGSDPGCASPADWREVSSTLPCDNGVDDDGDGAVDSADLGCVGLFDGSELPGGQSATCGLGPELALVLPLLFALYARLRPATTRPVRPSPSSSAV